MTYSGLCLCRTPHGGTSSAVRRGEGVTVWAVRRVRPWPRGRCSHGVGSAPCAALAGAECRRFRATGGRTSPLRACMHIYMYIVHMSMHACMHATHTAGGRTSPLRACMHMYMHIVHMSMHACMHATHTAGGRTSPLRAYACICICMHMYMHAYVYAYAYVYVCGMHGCGMHGWHAWVACTHSTTVPTSRSDQARSLPPASPGPPPNNIT